MELSVGVPTCSGLMMMMISVLRLRLATVTWPNYLADLAAKGGRSVSGVSTPMNKGNGPAPPARHAACTTHASVVLPPRCFSRCCYPSSEGFGPAVGGEDVGVADLPAVESAEEVWLFGASTDDEVPWGRLRATCAPRGRVGVLEPAVVCREVPVPGSLSDETL
jgi:hypothetical protein